MALIKMIPLKEEFRRNPELKESDLQILRDWCNKQPHLPKISDNELILFLHSNYYQMESTKTTIDTYYTIRTHVPEFFSNRDPIGTKDLRYGFTVTSQMTLDGRTREGYKVILAKLIDYDPSHYVYNDSMKYFSMIVDLWLLTEGTGNGHVIIIDVQGIVFGHVGRLSPMGLKKYLIYLQEAMPVRLKGVHFINANAIMDIILSMMKPFMKKELLEVLHIHTSMETLEPFVPIEILPNELGGKGGNLKDLQQRQLKQLEDHRAWFQQEEISARVDESLRPGKSKNAFDLFGVEGTFKKLEID